jgi:CheY-like chemotaxis protein
MGSAINPRILIVDDDENVLEMATTLLRRLGYSAIQR